MKPLYVLIITFIISLAASWFIEGDPDYSLSGRIAMCLMLCFTAIGHFKFVKGMTMMVPEIVPFKKEVVYITGLLEIIAGICLLVPDLKVSTAWALIVFFIILLPGNIKAAQQHIDYEKGTYEGPGLNYLWFRIPLQLFFIVWTWYFAIKTEA